MPKHPEFITSAQAAELITQRSGYPILQRQVQNLCKPGKNSEPPKLESMMVAGTLLIKRSSVLKFKRSKPGVKSK